MYGFKRCHVPRPVNEHPSINLLRDKGFGAEITDGTHYLVAGTMLYWPRTGHWRSKDGARMGYGVDSLVAAISPVAALASIDFSA